MLVESDGGLIAVCDASDHAVKAVFGSQPDEPCKERFPYALSDVIPSDEDGALDRRVVSRTAAERGERGEPDDAAVFFSDDDGVRPRSFQKPLPLLFKSARPQVKDGEPLHSFVVVDGCDAFGVVELRPADVHFPNVSVFLGLGWTLGRGMLLAPLP